MIPRDIDKSGHNLVHKQNSANCMIGVPLRVSDTHYQADVFLDDRCSELDDHVTGQHISGMILIEASRQMFLAVTELYYLKDYSKDSYFVIKRNSSEFKKFVFPVDIKIDYRVVHYEIYKPGVLNFKVTMDVLQCEKVCTTVEYDFITYDDEIISDRESVLSKDIIKLSAVQKSNELWSQEDMSVNEEKSDKAAAEN